MYSYISFITHLIVRFVTLEPEGGFHLAETCSCVNKKHSGTRIKTDIFRKITYYVFILGLYLRTEIKIYPYLYNFILLHTYNIFQT